MADADMLSLGTHCEHPDCSLLDFLPFTCDACGHVYCLDHRSYKAHSCSKAAGKESTTLVCPMCAKAVKLVPGQDPNVAFEAHTLKVDCMRLSHDASQWSCALAQYSIQAYSLAIVSFLGVTCRTVTPATMPEYIESSSALFQGARRS